MEGMARFVNRIYRLFALPEAESAEIVKAEQRLIKKVGEDIERRHYNTAISAIMKFVNEVSRVGKWANEQRGFWRYFWHLWPPFGRRVMVQTRA